MSCIGRLHNIMKKNILILEGRETIGGGQIITKKICKILSESNNVSVFIPGEKNAISDYLSEYRIFNYKIKEYTRGKKKNKDYIYFRFFVKFGGNLFLILVLYIYSIRMYY